MQEEAAVRQEQIRRNTEEQIQAQRRQTEKERAEIERETIRVRAMAEAEGRAHEAKISEDINRRLLVERANMEKDKVLAAINSTFGHIGGKISLFIRSVVQVAFKYVRATLMFTGKLFTLTINWLGKAACSFHSQSQYVSHILTLHQLLRKRPPCKPLPILKK